MLRVSRLRPLLFLALPLLYPCLASPACAQSGSLVTVNSDNVLVINGTKSFPIGFSPGPPTWGKTPTGADALQELRDAGAILFRMAQSTPWDATVISNQQAALDWAAQHGMYCWVNLRELSAFPSTDTNTPAALRSVVDTFRSHPALGVWKNFDEAWWSGVSASDLQNGYLVAKQEDTNHPIVQTHAPRGTATDLQPYNAAADVLALDIYPVAIPPPTNPPLTNTNISVVGDWTSVLGQVAAGQKEFWTIEQIAFSGTTPPSHSLIFPTYTQSRYMAYQALIDGARGLTFFGGNIAATLNAQDAALGWNWTFWNNVLKPVVQQLGDHSPLAPALTTTNSTLPIAITGTTSPDLEFCAREAPPYLFLLAAKREGSAANVTFTGLPQWAANGEVLFEAPRTLICQNGQFTDAFPPFAVHVYRFSQGNQPATILFAPQNQTNYIGTSAGLTVFADGTGPLSYQWRRSGTNLSNGGNIAGTTTATLVLSNVQPDDTATYDVIVTGFGSVTSAPALLLVSNQPPQIITQPQSRTSIAGTVGSFSVEAIGTGPLSYQWRKDGHSLADGGNLSGASSSTLSLASVSPSDVGAYDVIVSGFGAVTSSPAATLTVINQSLLLYEPFNYTNSGGPVNSNNPVNWTFNGSGANDLNVSAGNLAYNGLAASIGASVTNGGAGLGTRRLFGSAVSTGAVYFSALFRVNDLGYGAWNGVASQVGALTATDNQSFRLAVMVRSNSPTGYVIGVQKGGTGATATFGAGEYHAGDTLFLAGKYDFTASPNRVCLWVNPNPAGFGLAAEPASAPISASTGIDGFTIDRFNLRQNTASSVPAAMQWDELRVGLTWAAVTPPVSVLLVSPRRLADGSFQFAFTNIYNAGYSVYSSTNLLDWISNAPATQIAPGLFQFTDPGAVSAAQRFYQLRVP